MLKKIFALTSAALLLCSAALADGDISVNTVFNASSKELTVSGTAKGSTSVTVFKEALSSGELSLSNMPVVLSQIETNGTYSYTVGLPDTLASGKYEVCVSNSFGEASAFFVYIDPAAAEKTVQSLRAEQESDDFSNFSKLIADNAIGIGIDSDDEVFADNSASIIAFLYDISFEDYDEFAEAYNQAYIISLMKGKTGTELKSIINENQSKLLVSYDDILPDSRLTKAAEAKLLSMIASEDYCLYIDGKGEFSFAEAFEQMKILASLNTAQYWSELKTAITVTYSSVFADMLSLDTYKVVSDKDSVFEKMYTKIIAGEIFSSDDDVTTAFTAAADAVYESEKSKAASSNKTSFGGGGSTVISTPSFEPVDTVDAQQVPTGKFADFDNTHWSYTAVNALRSLGIIGGFPDGTFRSEAHVTRAEFAKLIVSFADGLESGDTADFGDVSENDWYYEYVTDASAKKIILGDDEGCFNPNDSIKRQDAAVIIYRILSAKGEAPIAHRFFADRKEISDYAKDAVEALGSVGIINGNENEYFMPQAFLTRAEASQLIYNAFVNGEER